MCRTDLPDAIVECDASRNRYNGDSVDCLLHCFYHTVGSIMYTDIEVEEPTTCVRISGGAYGSAEIGDCSGNARSDFDCMASLRGMDLMEDRQGQPNSHCPCLYGMEFRNTLNESACFQMNTIFR